MKSINRGNKVKLLYYKAVLLCYTYSPPFLESHGKVSVRERQYCHIQITHEGVDIPYQEGAHYNLYLCNTAYDRVHDSHNTLLTGYGFQKHLI